MPVQKAEALFDFQPTAQVELQMKVSPQSCHCTACGLGTGGLSVRFVQSWLLHDNPASVWAVTWRQICFGPANLSPASYLA